MKRQPRGFMLVESLIALLLLSVGLLGAWALQLASLRAHTDSMQQAAATELLRDMADRIRANPTARAHYGSPPDPAYNAACVAAARLQRRGTGRVRSRAVRASGWRPFSGKGNRGHGRIRARHRPRRRRPFRHLREMARRARPELGHAASVGAAGGGLSVRTGRTRGFSLTELMIALTLGLFLTAAFVAVLDRCRRESATNESVAQLQESARHALDALAFDLEHAGFFAGADVHALRLVRGATLLATGDDLRQPENTHPRLAVAGLPAGAHDCGVNFATDLELAVQGANGGWPAGRDARDCSPTKVAGGVRAGSDTFTVRRASLETARVHAGRLQLYTRRRETHGAAWLFADGQAPGVLDADADLRDLEMHSYYVGNNAVARSGWPALRVKELTESGGNVQFRDEELMPGVEDLQVEFGVLDTRSGAPRISFVPADFEELRDRPAVAVRLWLRIRAESTESGYLDARTLRYADVEFVPNALEAAQRRLLVQRTVALRNTRPP